jgi:hypothetical protein
MSNPTLVLGERYEPRICAAHNCDEPPIATYLIVAPGAMYGRTWLTGERMHICGMHENQIEGFAR